jgi:hypothetical protein
MSFGRTMTRLATLGAVLIACMAGIASAYPGGTPDFQTDVAPYCAACHASTADSDLLGLGDRARSELAAHKHLASIKNGVGPYAELNEADRAKLVEWLAAVDRNSTIFLETPAQVTPGQTFQVTVKVTGGAGPSVGVALVDRAHRFFARPASAVGWQVEGAPTIIGPKGPQSDWLERRPEREGRSITFVNVEGIESNAALDKWSRAKIVFTLKAPLTVGDYPLVGAYFYGTETGNALSTRIHPKFGPQPLGGVAGTSGRIKFSDSTVISVRDGAPIQPVADPDPAIGSPTP